VTFKSLSSITVAGAAAELNRIPFSPNIRHLKFYSILLLVYYT